MLSPDRLQAWLATLGAWAPLVGIFVTALENIFTPLPVLALTLVNSYLFGPWLGSLVSWLGSLLGSLTVFGVARGGRRLSRWRPSGRLGALEQRLAGAGFRAVLLARLIPILPSTAVNLAAGVSRIGVGSFVAGTALGKLPAILVYSFVGAGLSSGVWWQVALALGVAVLALVGEWGLRRGRLRTAGSAATPPSQPGKGR